MTWQRGQTITVVRPGAKTPLGDRLPETSHPVENVVIDWTGSSLNFGHGMQEISDVVIFLPVGSDIARGDRVQLPDGDRYFINGKIAPWQSPFTGRQPGLAVKLKAVTG